MRQFSILAVLIIVIASMAMWVSTGFGTTVAPLVENLKLGLDIEGGVVVVYEVKSTQEGDDLQQVVEQTRLVLEKRVNEMGLSEPNVYVEGTNRIRVELPGVSNAQEALETIGTIAKLEFALVNDGDRVNEGDQYDESRMTIIFNGGQVKNGTVTQDQNGHVAVGFSLYEEGAEQFKNATLEAIKHNGGSGGQIAILLDKEIISAPRAKVVISNGESIIQGNFTYEEANELALLIRAGALPADIEELSSQAIGPTLGRQALDLSIYAGLVGFGLVIAFMVAYYRLPGLIASIALILYGAIILALMVAMKATLTLPGVAGIVLSVGMAVDANVIIFERIKEELKEGKTLRASLGHGFSKAFKTILDSNITTLIAAVVLYSFGTGPIKGFAITLMLGIVTSMFTAIVITRTLLSQVIGLKAFANKKFYGA